MPRAGAKICHHSRQGQRKSLGKRTATCVVFVCRDCGAPPSARPCRPTALGPRPRLLASRASTMTARPTATAVASRGYSCQSIRAGRGGGASEAQRGAAAAARTGGAVGEGLRGLPPDCLRLGLVGLLPALALATRSARDRPPQAATSSATHLVAVLDMGWDLGLCALARQVGADGTRARLLGCADSLLQRSATNNNVAQGDLPSTCVCLAAGSSAGTR